MLHLLVDDIGNPLSITTTPANGNERDEVEKLLSLSQIDVKNESLRNREMVILEADKGYDCQWLRTSLLAKGIFPLIPRRRIGKPSPDRPTLRQVCDFFKITSTRWKVERTFSWLKRKFRRLMVRWERRLNAWQGMATLSLVYFWIEILVR